MNFSREQTGTKVNVNRACLPKEKHSEFTKMAEIMNFSFWPFLWFGSAGATPEKSDLFTTMLCSRFLWKSVEIGRIVPTDGGQM